MSPPASGGCPTPPSASACSPTGRRSCASHCYQTAPNLGQQFSLEDRVFSFSAKSLGFCSASHALRRKPLPQGCLTHRHLASLIRKREEVPPMARTAKKAKAKGRFAQAAIAGEPEVHSVLISPPTHPRPYSLSTATTSYS